MNITTYNEGAHPLIVDGSDMILQGCSIDSIQPLLYVQFLDTSILGLTATTLGTSVASYFEIATDTCTESMSVSIGSGIGDGRLAFSQTLFDTDPTQLLTHSLIGSARIYGVAPTLSGLSVLTSTGLYYGNQTSPLGSLASWTAGLNRMRFPDVCDASNSYSSIYNSVIVLWDSTARSTSSVFTIPIQVSLNGGQSFTTVRINVDSGNSGSNGYIRDVAHQHTYTSLLILVRDANGNDRLGSFNLESWTWTNGFDFNNSGLVLDGGVKGAATGVNAMAGGGALIYGDALYYTYVFYDKLIG